MSRSLIRLGDATTHGGVVVTATSGTHVEGAAPACVGDLTICPIPGHGVQPILTGDDTTKIDGKAAARGGDLTGCGAVLIPSQDTTRSE